MNGSLRGLGARVRFLACRLEMTTREVLLISQPNSHRPTPLAQKGRKAVSI